MCIFIYGFVIPVLFDSISFHVCVFRIKCDPHDTCVITKQTKNEKVKIRHFHLQIEIDSGLNDITSSTFWNHYFFTFFAIRRRHTERD